MLLFTFTMDSASIRAEAYAIKFASLIQHNGYTIDSFTYDHDRISVNASGSGVYGGSVYCKGVVHCYTTHDACIVQTKTRGLRYPQTESPFDINCEIFIDCPAFHWTVDSWWEPYCGYCRTMLIDEDVPCFKCYLRRRDLLELHYKGKILVICKKDTALVPDIINIVVQHLAILTACQRANVTKIIR